jgi:NADPH2:quinone reductase
VDSNDSNWSDHVRELTGGRGADVIYDSVGGEITDRSLKCIAFGGRLLVIGFASGTIPSVALNRVMLKHIALVGLHLGGYAEHDPSKLKTCMQELFSLHRAGKVRPHVHAVLPLTEAAHALRLLESRKVQGKILLSPTVEPA